MVVKVLEIGLVGFQFITVFNIFIFKVFLLHQQHSIMKTQRTVLITPKSELNYNNLGIL